MNLNEFIKHFESAEIIGDKIVINNNIYDVLKFLSENFHFNTLKNITAIDNGNNQIELLYHMYSIEDCEDLIISKTVQNEIESVSNLFKSAIADEREIYDLFGINFINHENLQRLYMPEDWEGAPLRKDYIESDERLAWNDNENNV